MRGVSRLGVYAALLRDRERLTFAESQQRMKESLVAAYKLTPINPTLLEARDALLAVARAGQARLPPLPQRLRPARHGHRRGGVVRFPPILPGATVTREVAVTLDGPAAVQSLEFTLAWRDRAPDAPEERTTLFRYQANYGFQAGVSRTETVEAPAPPWTSSRRTGSGFNDVPLWQRTEASQTLHSRFEAAARRALAAEPAGQPQGGVLAGVEERLVLRLGPPLPR